MTDEQVKEILTHAAYGMIKQFITSTPEIHQHLTGRARYVAAACKSVGDKTYDHYLRQIGDAVLDLWRGDISEGEFVDLMADIIAEQLRKAWNEGMRNNGLDPESDMLEEWEQEYQDIVANEYSFVDGFAADIVERRGAMSEDERNSVPGDIIVRESVWAGRYNDVVNQATLITASAGEKLEWVVGETEHCETCAALNGIVAFASEWEEAGVQPQAPPNDAIICGGWNCQCFLEPTDSRRSPNALSRIMDIATAANL